MDAIYKQNYRNLYLRHWWWRARESLLLSTIERIRHTHSSERILDIGCGDALLFDQLSRFGDVEGVELDSSLVSKDSPWRNRIYIGPFDDMFKPGKKYSLILMLDVLEHSIDAQSTLCHALELLDDDGFIVITVPAFPCLWTGHDNLNKHFRRYTKKSIRQLAYRAGMKLVLSRYFFNWTFPVKFAVSLKERCFGSESKIPRVPPLWLNEALFRISLVEQRVSSNISMPFGSSLIAVGTKQ